MLIYTYPEKLIQIQKPAMVKISEEQYQSLLQTKKFYNNSARFIESIEIRRLKGSIMDHDNNKLNRYANQQFEILCLRLYEDVHSAKFRDGLNWQKYGAWCTLDREEYFPTWQQFANHRMQNSYGMRLAFLPQCIRITTDFPPVHFKWSTNSYNGRRICHIIKRGVNITSTTMILDNCLQSLNDTTFLG
jgi:hypothetical protein